MKKNFQLRIEPRDLLFCRDAKPMEGSFIGQGGNLPQPVTLHRAFLRALQQRHGSVDGHDHRFSSLQTGGPFLEKVDGDECGIYFPTPLDLMPDGSVLIPRKMRGCNNLPKPLSKVLCYGGVPTKREIPRFLNSRQFVEEYLQKGHCWASEVSLFDTEVRPGIAIDRGTRCVDKDASAFYMAEYLRLRPGVGLSAFVHLDDEEQLLDVFGVRRTAHFQLGGQQCTVTATLIREKRHLLNCDPFSLFPSQELSTRVKWVLLTPSYWESGWLPNFVDTESGKVTLRTEKPERREGESRKDWRTRMAVASLKTIEARLIAARVGSAVAVSGWHQLRNCPRPTRLLVPAGSVFYFETDSVESSKALIAALHGRTMSQIYGECGYGLGVCTIYNEA